jgi:hypothetical protein
MYCRSKTFDKIAIVTFKNLRGDYAIDRKEKVLFEVLISDLEPALRDIYNIIYVLMPIWNWQNLVQDL